MPLPPQEPLLLDSGQVVGSALAHAPRRGSLIAQATFHVVRTGLAIPQLCQGSLVGHRPIRGEKKRAGFRSSARRRIDSLVDGANVPLERNLAVRCQAGVRIAVADDTTHFWQGLAEYPECTGKGPTLGKKPGIRDTSNEKTVI